MTKKKLIAGLFFCTLATAFAASSLGAATVSFLVIEANLPDSGATNQYSILWENGLMEVFYESGHIVTNSPILRLNTKPALDFPPEAKNDLELARGGGMDYFLIALVDYPVPTRRMEAVKPQNVSMCLFTTGSGKMLWKQEYAVSGAKTVKEEYEFIKKAIGDMAVQIK